MTSARAGTGADPAQTGAGEPPSGAGRRHRPPLHLTAPASSSIREEIARAGGSEVCFLARVGVAGDVYEPLVVARGHATAVPAAAREAEPGSLVLHNHPSGALAPSDADLEVGARLHERGLGLAITDNEAAELYVVVEPLRPREVRLIDPDAVDAVLAPGGAVAGAHPAYEDRPTQRAMARAVAEAYNQRGILLAEAGTGTGKSIAYLIPALQWAAANAERTVVSTNTINLQEQLAGKDLPFLARTLEEPVRWALVKGRGNYISIRRALLARETAPALFDDDRTRELEEITTWLETTTEGSLQDLPFQPSEEVWDEVVSETDVCLRARCPHFERCFYQTARRRAAAAQVLVVNHHLLFSDLAVRRAAGNFTGPAVLPPYRRVVLDEAHNLEDAATAHLGATLSRRGLFRLLGRLERRGRGLLPAVEARLRSGDADLLRQDALREVDGRLRPAVERARELGGELFRRLELLLVRSPSGVLRIDESLRAEAAWDGLVVPALEDLGQVLADLRRGLEALCERIRLDERWAEALEAQLVELEAAGGRTAAAAVALQLALAGGQGEVPMVRWIERRGARGAGGDRAAGGNPAAGARGQAAEEDPGSVVVAGGSAPAAPSGVNVAIRAAPVDLSALLRETLFERVDTAVLTSATLSTRDGFDFLRSRLGLGGGGLRLREGRYPSPFDYASQTLVAVPTDLGSVREGTAFDRRAADALVDLVRVTDGGVMALFTSYRALRITAARLRERGVAGRWPLLVQGEGPRVRLLDAFARSGRGILLGVASFWEGIDVPGDPLRALVIARLPFPVPDEPVTAARAEAVEAEGGSAFFHFMLPQAALRLKQGFGRLVRTRADRGAVVLLDERILGRPYGRYFLESLPDAPLVSGSWSELVPSLAAFYGTPAVPPWREDSARPTSSPLP